MPGSRIARPEAIEPRDLAAMAGVCSLLEGAMWGGDLPPRFVRKLARKLTSTGWLSEDWTELQLRSELANVGARIQFALGDRDSEPEQLTAPPRDPRDPRERGL